MNPVISKDGSVTFFNEHVQEHYHSTSGAIEEAVKKFAEPLLPYLEHTKNIKILDVGFGLGYTSAALLELLAGKKQSITFYCLESDMGIIQKIHALATPLSSYVMIKKAAEAFSKGNVTFSTLYQKTTVTFHLLLGDAKQTIHKVSNIDAVLFDPFSPKKQPDLWTKELLSAVQKSMLPGSALTTYSCAKTFRDTLRELGFTVVNGPCIGRKAPSTIAVKAM